MRVVHRPMSRTKPAPPPKPAPKPRKARAPSLRILAGAKRNGIDALAPDLSVLDRILSIRERYRTREFHHGLEKAAITSCKRHFRSLIQDAVDKGEIQIESLEGVKVEDPDAEDAPIPYDDDDKSPSHKIDPLILKASLALYNEVWDATDPKRPAEPGLFAGKEVFNLALISAAGNMAMIRFNRDLRLTEEKIMTLLASGLPGFTWWCSNKGMSGFGFSQLVGVAGDIGSYATVAKLWKRMGVGLVLDPRTGTWGRQRKVSSRSGKTKEDREVLAAIATSHGFSPKRRAVLHCLVQPVVFSNKEAMRLVYDTRKAVELSKLPEDVQSRKKIAEIRTRRYLGKHMLKHLWIEWRRDARLPFVEAADHATSACKESVA